MRTGTPYPNTICGHYGLFKRPMVLRILMYIHVNGQHARFTNTTFGVKRYAYRQALDYLEEANVISTKRTSHGVCASIVDKQVEALFVKNKKPAKKPAKQPASTSPNDTLTPLESPPIVPTRWTVDGRDFPSELETNRFRSAWVSWLEYRKEIRKPMRERTQQMQLKKLCAMGHDGAIASIEQSIANGWVGLFEPKQENITQSKIENEPNWKSIIGKMPDRIKALAEKYERWENFPDYLRDELTASLNAAA